MLHPSVFYSVPYFTRDGNTHLAIWRKISWQFGVILTCCLADTYDTSWPFIIGSLIRPCMINLMSSACQAGEEARTGTE